MSTSFLDVLSNGLGAGILLMILIAAIPIDGPAAGVPDAPFIRASWTVGGDVGAILYLRILPPGAASPMIVDTRRLAEGAVMDLACRWPGVTPGGSAQIYGFTSAGTAAGLGRDDQGAMERTFVLWVTEPMPGDWQLGVVYSNRSDSVLLRAADIEVVPTIEIRSEVMKTAPTLIGLGSVHMDAFGIDMYDYDLRDDTRPICTNWF